jgi:hypothetical protein
MPRQRLIVATLILLGAFVSIAQLAWTTASDTTDPWFSADLSRQVYSTTMIGALVVLATLAAVASWHAATIAREARGLDLRLAILRGSGVVGTGPGIDIDRDIEETLDEILGGTSEPPAPVVTVERDASDTILMAATTELKGARQDVVLREVARVRSGLHAATTRIWGAVAGPMAGAMLFLGIGGAMLPGSGGFAETHYVLNTALILFLSYGWMLLAGWTVIGLGFARASETRHGPEAKRA